jgi:hypothetical protein
MEIRQDLEETRRAIQVMVNGFNDRNPQHAIVDLDCRKHHDNAGRVMLIEVLLEAQVRPWYEMGDPKGVVFMP